MSISLEHPFAGVTGLLARIGNTPLVRLRHVRAADGGELPSGIEIWAKLEGANPGGSVKDRAALAMVLRAEREGRLTKDVEILDASSGNTGIAYGLVASQRGHRVTLCLPKNANAERKAALRAYGVRVVETSPLEGSDGAILAARALSAAEPGRYVYLDQYANDANWRAHLHSTGPEIWAALEGRLTHFVAALGTSGTFVGIARFLQAQRAPVRCVAVEPDAPFHGLEGLKHMASAIVPPIFDPALASERLGAPTEASLALVRSLARDEGLLVGPSSGAALWGALEIARRVPRGERAVIATIFPDRGDRYLSEPHIFGGPS